MVFKHFNGKIMLKVSLNLSPSMCYHKQAPAAAGTADEGVCDNYLSSHWYGFENEEFCFANQNFE